MFLCILINSRFSRFIRLDWFTPRFNAVVFNIWYYFGTSKPGRSDVLIFVFSSFSFIISTILFLYTSFSIAIIRLSLRACLLFGDALMIFCTVSANLSGNLRFCPFHSLHFLTKCEELSLLHIEFDLYLLYSSHIFCFSFFWFLGDLLALLSHCVCLQYALWSSCVCLVNIFFIGGVFLTCNKTGKYI